MNDIFRYELYHDGIVQDYKNTLIVIILALIIRLIQNKLISHVNNNLNSAICYLGKYFVKQNTYNRSGVLPGYIYFPCNCLFLVYHIWLFRNKYNKKITTIISVIKYNNQYQNLFMYFYLKALLAENILYTLCLSVTVFL